MFFPIPAAQFLFVFPASCMLSPGATPHLNTPDMFLLSWTHLTPTISCCVLPLRKANCGKCQTSFDFQPFGIESSTANNSAAEWFTVGNRYICSAASRENTQLLVWLIELSNNANNKQPQAAWSTRKCLHAPYTQKCYQTTNLIWSVRFHREKHAFSLFLFLHLYLSRSCSSAPSLLLKKWRPLCSSRLLLWERAPNENKRLQAKADVVSTLQHRRAGHWCLPV